jgi:anaerobic selenocysteine-containing dehydrogenase
VLIGREDAEMMLDELAGLLGGRGPEFWDASTGVIGWRLPAEEMRADLPSLAAGLQTESILPAAVPTTCPCCWSWCAGRAPQRMGYGDFYPVMCTANHDV